MTITDYFTETFRAEHRQVRDLLLALIAAFRAGDPRRISALVSALSAATGPHFRYEEEAMYPVLVSVFGREYVDKLLSDHDGTIRNVRELAELAELYRPADLYWPDEPDEAQAAWGIELTREILPHVSDCDGLSLMVETLPEDDVVHILATRDVARESNLDLLTWAGTVRGRHV
ncbi:hemerythrin domain-containing protein [Nonomuraea pusilla]|uniref:Hemerythrin HHE cation binding domain-containing protein n=1 Tax=Nonomuraea pusilla TaxID=46177 RepID=A0A1H7TQS4_9ACTN|nr:hemerythrin domain-containing protein [Nonomuraea pusilla]SEL86839.1 Hemerythrin HHE cation binding domain-containing protein [Nonomuraea pusilla]